MIGLASAMCVGPLYCTARSGQCCLLVFSNSVPQCPISCWNTFSELCSILLCYCKIVSFVQWVRTEDSIVQSIEQFSGEHLSSAATSSSDPRLAASDPAQCWGCKQSPADQLHLLCSAITMAQNWIMMIAEMHRYQGVSYKSDIIVLSGDILYFLEIN